ncbi:baseplate assembly protein [Salmonella enterica]|nr:baseplate assembly protein [Salmonella enterica]EBV6969625.1 baseplate assembly protein [Salmonella enterica subsp. enterica serovar Gaminara]ECF2941187.1 baseplate assembly protein [Salmonella enterica subsp. enterica serovar Reading]ECH1486211.1 baseplate assembly protein [Salmonella enterica subsp. enterica serovar Bredeney]ECH9261669.1 baseplate assembly protein [Salmonella enterica subsp. enterica]ECO0311823.1 baseplate assembly protein [Salmonella enterica subsp. enterica serovar Schw
MIGIDATTGRHLHGADHLRQSVTDILMTPSGTRVLLRDYGSDLFRLVDNPQDDFLRVRIVRATATALEKWEPRFTVRRVEVTWIARGQFALTLVGTNNETRETLRLEGIKIGNTTGNH